MNDINPLWRGTCTRCNKKCSSARMFCGEICKKQHRIENNNIIIGETKRCNSCKQIKDVGLFGVNRVNKDGLMYQCKDCNRVRVNKYNKTRGPVKTKPQVTKHGLTSADYDAMLVLQDSKCAVCKEELISRICIDHDHKCCDQTYSCGQCVRGLLCTPCNLVLGIAKDKVSTFESAIKYLNKHG